MTDQRDRRDGGPPEMKAPEPGEQAEIAAHQQCVCADTPAHCRACAFEVGWPCLVRLTAERDAALAENAALRAAGDAMAKALDRCMVGGNHLASSLISALGAGFTDEITSSDQALAVLWGKRADTDDMLYDVWMCWRAIMDARTLAGGPDWLDGWRALAPAGRGATDGEGRAE